MKNFLIILLLCSVVVFVSCNIIPYDVSVSDGSGTFENSSSEIPKAEASNPVSGPSASEISEEKSETEVSKPELNGALEVIDLDCEIEIIKMPFIAENPGIAGNFQFGHLLSSSENMVLDDVMRSAYDTKDYDEWVKKYTDEWFNENWLIKFIVYQPSFDYEETGVYIGNAEDSEPLMYFYIGEEEVRENVKPNDPHYYVFIEIPKENIEYDLSDFYFMLLTDLTYDSEIN